MRKWTTRIPTFQSSTPSAQPIQNQPVRNYQQVQTQIQPQIQQSVPSVTPSYQPAKAQVTQATQTQRPIAQMQPVRSPLTTTFLPRSQVLRERRNNPQGSRNKQPIRKLHMPGGRTMGVGSPFIGPVDRQIKGIFDPKDYGRQPIDSKNYALPPALSSPSRQPSLADYDLLGLSAPNDPRNNPIYDNWDDVNGDIPFPTQDWTMRDGVWGNASPDTVAEAPKFDYMGRPLGYGGQVIWDENGNIIPAVAAQYEAQGLSIPTSYTPGYDPGFAMDKHLGSGRPQLNTIDGNDSIPTSNLGTGRPVLNNNPNNNHSIGFANNSIDNTGNIQKTLRYISDLGFDPLQVVQSPALMDILLNRGMY